MGNVIAFVLVVIVSLSAKADVVTISDQTFNPASWDLVNLGGTNVTSMTESVGGGISGNGRLITVNGFGNITYRAENYKTDLVLNPSTGCQIQSIAWQYWYYYTRPSEFASVQIIARQGSAAQGWTDYVAGPSFREPRDDNGWQLHNGSLSAADFSRLRGPGPVTLDFSPGAAPIQFGYANYSSVFIPSPATHLLSFFVLDITRGPLAPTIQPTSANVCRLGSANFSVMPVGTGPFTYRWRRNGTMLGDQAGRITGSSTSALRLTNVTASDAGAYDCTFSNACGTAASNAATLTVCVADFDCSGGISVQDVFDYLAAYFSGNSRADMNESGSLSVQDLLEFVAAYFAGCT